MLYNFITVSFLLLQAAGLFAWGQNGHRIVAEICDKHLSAEAKAELQKIMGPDYLAELTTWPDYIKSEKGWRFAESWHYTTINTNQTVSDVRSKYDGDAKINDAIEAIELMTDILKGDTEAIAWLEDMMEKNGAAPLRNSTKATALAFLAHLVGDIHQPLHVGKNRDKGGNSITVLFFSDRTNIHSVWDTKIIEHEALSYTEFAHFINKCNPEEVSDMQSATLDQWAEESISLREDIYNTIYDYVDRDTGLPSFSWRYQHDYIVHVKHRLLQSGVRLAGVLNEVFG